MRSLSSSMTKQLLHSAAALSRKPASGDFLERGRPGDGRRKLTAVLRSGLGRIAGGKAIQHLAEILLVQVLVGVLPDQDHRRIHAGAEALDLLPTEIAVFREMEGIVVDTALADLDDIARAAQPARRGAADLDMRLLADRRELEHRVKGRDL